MLYTLFNKLNYVALFKFFSLSRVYLKNIYEKFCRRLFSRACICNSTCRGNVRAEMAHKNIALKSHWKIRTSLWLRGQRARESISTCSNKLHGKFVSRRAAVYRASGLNFSSICDISRANCSDYKSFARCIFGHTRL